MGIFINLIVVLEMIPEIAEAGPPQICSFRFQLDFFIPSFFLWEHLRKLYILEDFPSNQSTESWLPTRVECTLWA